MPYPMNRRAALGVLGALGCGLAGGAWAQTDAAAAAGDERGPAGKVVFLQIHGWSPVRIRAACRWAAP